jgi:citrate lyase beta subunit
MPRSLQAISSRSGGRLTKPDEQPEGLLAPLLAGLAAELGAADAVAPFEGRRPVHTVYGGAHLFTHDVAQRLGRAALRHLDEWAPDFVAFARAVRLPGGDRLPSVTSERAKLLARFDSQAAGTRAAEPHAHIALATWERMRERLARSAVEDYRIDFEDGFGFRSDAEEDERARGVAAELARGLEAGTLPPAIGIRIKPFTAESCSRAARTLELVVGAIVAGTAGRLPDGFVVTLPKVTRAVQVSALADCCDALERRHKLAAGSLRVELMVETPESVIAQDGTVPLRALVAAARGRCRGVHFGAYDYTAACGIAAAHQSLSHPACVLARQIMRTALAGTDVVLSDGAVTTLPVGPHRAPEGGRLTPREIEANRAAVLEGWRVHFDEVRRALREGFDQGWDLHPGQLATRHAAVISFYLEARDEAAARLAAFVERAAQASRHGSIMEDAATGQGLLNFFLRGLACGALVEADVLGTGLTLEEIRGRSFARIAERREARTGSKS